VNKRILVLITLLLISLVCAPCRPAPREVISLNGFEVTLSEPKVEFPSSITFDIEVESDAIISEVTLQYQVDKLSPIPVTSVAFPEFEPASKVKTSWTWDMSKTGGLPPGTELRYWWVIEDAEGDKVKIPEDTIYTLEFSDNRHSWSSLRDDKVRLWWYQGDASFAAELMDATQDALRRLAADTGAELEQEANIYIYAPQDLQGAMIYPQEWTGGVAFTEYSTIAIGISPDPDYLSWGKGAIAHELTHLVIHQLTASGYGVTLPTWLDEGLAVYGEGALSYEMRYILVEALRNDELFTVQTLCSPFSADPEEAYLSYAQSYSLVEYLLKEQGGGEKMLQLLNAFKEGSGYEEALNKVYDLDIGRLDNLWREYIKANL